MLVGQVGSITRNSNADGSSALIVSQPGGALLRVNCRSHLEEKARLLVVGADSEGEGDLMATIGDVDYEEMASYQMRNPNVSSEIVGSFIEGDEGEGDNDDDAASPYAICTLDGNLILAKKDEILWSYQVGRRTRKAVLT